MEKKHLYTADGYEALRLLRIAGIDTEDAKRIIVPMDNELSELREKLRQYQACYGPTHDWLRASTERIRVARMALDDAEEAYNEHISDNYQ